MRSLWLVMLAILTVSMLTGCSANVGQQLLVERDAFNGTLIAVHTAHITGALSAADEAKLLPALDSVQAALDAADAAYKSGDVKGATVYLQAISAGLAKLAELYPSVKAATTQPAKTSQRSDVDRPAFAGWFNVMRQPGHSYAAGMENMPNALMWRPLLMAV